MIISQLHLIKQTSGARPNVQMNFVHSPHAFECDVLARDLSLNKFY